MVLARAEDVSVLRRAFDEARVAQVGIDIQDFYCVPRRDEPEPDGDWYRMIGKTVARIGDFTAATRGRMNPVWVNHTNFAATGPDLGGDSAWRGFGRLGRGMLAHIFSTSAQRARAQLIGHHAVAGDMVIGKPEYDAFHKTNLDAVLRGRGVDTLVLTGFFTDQCVWDTAQTARKKGYEVFIAADMTRPAEATAADCWADFRRDGVRVVLGRDILTAMKNG